MFLVRRNWRSIFIAITIVADTLAIAVSGVGAYLLRGILPNVPNVELRTLLLFGGYFWVVLIFLGCVLGLYRASFHSNRRQQYFLGGKSYIYALLIILASFYIIQYVQFPRRFTFLFFLLLPFVFPIGRAVLNRFNLMMQKKGFGIHNALIVGYENEGIEIAERFTRFPELGYDIKGYASSFPERTPAASKRHGNPHEQSGALRRRYSFSEQPELLNTLSIDRIFVPSMKLFTNGFPGLVDLCRKERVKLKVLSPEADQLLRLNRIYDIAGITLYSPPRTKVEFIQKVVKRIFDVVGSLLMILVLSPIFLVTAAAIYLESSRPVLFKQKRASRKGGKSFYFYKFRSMVKKADEMKAGLFQLNESSGALFKVKNDPRMTKVGKIIRRFSIDELPQLFNVLKGDMTLVGPRPLPISDFEKANETKEFWEAMKEREKLKPGVTGLWQISGRSNLGFKEMLLLDFYYIENHSILFDLEILFATIPVVLFGKGAY